MDGALQVAPRLSQTHPPRAAQGFYGAQAVAKALKQRDGFKGAFVIDMSTEFKGTGSDGEAHPPCKGGRDGSPCDAIMLDTQTGRGGGDNDFERGDNPNMRMMDELTGAARRHAKSAEALRVTANPVSPYHTDTTPLWQEGLPAVYGATIAHRLYPQWHHADDTTENLGGDLGADMSNMAAGWLASSGASGADLERGDASRASCFSHFDASQMLDDADAEGGERSRHADSEDSAFDESLERIEEDLEALGRFLGPSLA